MLGLQPIAVHAAGTDTDVSRDMASKKKNSSDAANATDAFVGMLKAIEQRIVELPKAVRIRIERWVAKLAYHVDNPTWIRERNM